MHFGLPPDPARAQEQLIARITEKFRPLVKSRLMKSGVDQDVSLVMNEVRFQVWRNAISATTPDVESYVFGMVGLWVRTQLVSYSRNREYATPAEFFDIPVGATDPLEIVVTQWSTSRLVNHLTEHLGRDLVERLINGESRYRHSRGQVQRITRIVLAACDLADHTQHADIREIRQSCLEAEDQFLLRATREHVARSRGVTERTAYRWILRARTHQKIAVQTYRTEAHV